MHFLISAYWPPQRLELGPALGQMRLEVLEIDRDILPL